MLHKWGLHVPDAAEKASMQMCSPLSSALLWKVLLQVQSCISNFLHWKLPAYLKQMSFLCWALSPRIIQFYKFLTLLLCVDYNGSYFWGEGMEWRKTAVQSLCQILCCPAPCGVTTQVEIGYCRSILQFCVYLLSVHSSGPCSPDFFFFLVILCLCHQLLLKHFIWWTGLGDNCSS